MPMAVSIIAELNIWITPVDYVATMKTRGQHAANNRAVSRTSNALTCGLGDDKAPAADEHVGKSFWDTRLIL